AASAGVDPSVMGLGPIPASRKALARAGLRPGDMDWIEVNEAFASQVIACVRDLDLDPQRVNPNGGAIALGHPLGASGVRIIATLVHELARRKARYGLATMCIGVGQGIATVVENLVRQAVSFRLAGPTSLRLAGPIFLRVERPISLPLWA